MLSTFRYCDEKDEYKEALDFWSSLIRRESRVTSETIDMRWWSEESIDDVSDTKVQTVKVCTYSFWNLWCLYG